MITKLMDLLVHEFDVTPKLSRYNYMRSDRNRFRNSGVLICIVNNINICSFVCKYHDNGTHRLSFECCASVLNFVYHSSISLADDFILKHILL